MAEPTSRRTSRRPYHSPVRRRQAEQTRARILAAARDLFRSAGYAATTIDAIASSALVSAKTVEAVFGSKRGVLAALVDPLASAGPPRDLVDEIRAAVDPRHRLRLVTELTRRTYDASLPEFELMRGAAAVAPEITAVAQQIESRRRGSLTTAGRRLRPARTGAQAEGAPAAAEAHLGRPSGPVTPGPPGHRRPGASDALPDRSLGPR